MNTKPNRTEPVGGGAAGEERRGGTLLRLGISHSSSAPRPRLLRGRLSWAAHRAAWSSCSSVKLTSARPCVSFKTKGVSIAHRTRPAAASRYPVAYLENFVHDRVEEMEIAWGTDRLLPLFEGLLHHAGQVLPKLVHLGLGVADLALAQALQQAPSVFGLCPHHTRRER